MALPLPLDQTYTYQVPAEHAEAAQAGCRVLVPFGPRRLTGCIVDADADEPDGDFAVKDVLDVLDEAPALTAELLELTRWIADYYVCGWGEVIKAALPSGTGIKTIRRLRRIDDETGAESGEWAGHAQAGPLLRYLAERESVTLNGARQQVGDVPLALVRRLADDGLVEMTTELSDPQVDVKTERHVRFASAFRHDGAARDLRQQLRGHKQVAVVETLAGLVEAGEHTPRLADVMERAEAAHSTVNSLLDKGIIETIEREVNRSPLAGRPSPEKPVERVLHPAQTAALERIEAVVEARRFETFLLHGVTGSGKTEVYIAALKQVLAQGRTGIILVPEIALTPQTVRRFRAHFGDQIAVLHSRMSLGERFDAWRHLRAGRHRVVIGPRSAVLAPLDDLGLIVVDEEHEGSYKQFDPAPRYHARDVAVMRAHMAGATCILGSATPSLESYANAHWGKYTLLEMPDRVPVPGHEAAPLPEVQIVDLTKQRMMRRLEGALSEPLREAIRERLERGEQTILLQNRRGYAPVIECEACGWAPSCDDCSVTVTYHKTKRHLRCHYCGRTARLPQRCPKCNADDLTQIGTGTQRVEEELEEVFPEARLVRMDMDTTSRKDAHHQLLTRFGNGEADILLGTQMVAKGLDFARVTLVGVVNADTGLLMPDFRAEERTFQLLTQVAGRAGRADLRGEVILQTRNPKHPVLTYALAHDYLGFARYAAGERRTFGYPPFGRLAAIEFRGPREDRVQALARAWTAELKRRAAGIEVLGPEPALIGRIKKQYRYHTIVRAPRTDDAPALSPLLRAADAAHGSPPRGYHVNLDVDAVGLF